MHSSFSDSVLSLSSFLYRMASATQEPSEASRLEGVAEAGMGADDSEHTARLADNGSSDGAKSVSPAGSSEDVAEPKKEEQPEAPQRGKLKTSLIMFSLCVSLTKPMVISICS